MSLKTAQVDPALLAASSESFATSVQPDTPGRLFSQSFGARKLEKDMAILNMPVRSLTGAWEECVRAAMPAKIAVEDEIAKATREHVNGISST